MPAAGESDWVTEIFSPRGLSAVQKAMSSSGVSVVLPRATCAGGIVLYSDLIAAEFAARTASCHWPRGAKSWATTNVVEQTKSAMNNWYMARIERKFMKSSFYFSSAFNIQTHACVFGHTSSVAWYVGLRICSEF